MYYSITFGDLYTAENAPTASDIGAFRPIANTWDDWHLIPSSRPTIVTPQPITNFVKIPGVHGTLDLSTYLRTNPTYGARSGSIEFYVANGYEPWTTIRKKIFNVLTGKKIKMVLEDDPGFYYEGRITFKDWQPSAGQSTVHFEYHLNPYKYYLYKNASEDFDDDLWDTFNFESDRYKVDKIWMFYNESINKYESSITQPENGTEAVYKKERCNGGLL